MIRTELRKSGAFAPRLWHLANGRSVELGPAGVIVGIVNVTPDSFSDGGSFLEPDRAIAQARRLIGEGATIIDVGGESTRPGDVEAVSAEVEQARIMPVITALAKPGGPIISVDTIRAETARMAIEAGAHVVNDVWGLHRDPELADVASETRAGLILMHNGRERDRDKDVMRDQFNYLSRSLEIANRHGVPREQIVVDPGFGFAKDPDENIELLARLEALQEFGYPVMAGTSRKRFIGYFTGREAIDRDIGTAATSVVARLKGAALFRVHDVAANRDALAIADAVLGTGRSGSMVARGKP